MQSAHPFRYKVSSLIRLLLCVFSTFTLAISSKAQSSDYTNFYLKPGTKGKVKISGGIAAGGEIPSTRGNVGRRVDANSSEFLNENTVPVNQERLKSVLKKLRETILERSELSSEVKRKYTHEIFKLSLGEREVFVLDKILLPSRKGLYIVHAATTSAGKAGGSTKTPILISKHTTVPTLADFELSQEDLEETSSFSDDERLEHMINKIFQDVEMTSRESYLQHKLFVNILHELTHEVIPDTLFDRKNEDINGAEEAFVLEATEAIAHGGEFGDSVEWSYFKKGLDLESETFNLLEKRKTNASKGQHSKKRRGLRKLKPEERAISYIMNTKPNCDASGEIRYQYEGENENEVIIDLTSDSRRNRKICGKLEEFYRKNPFKEKIWTIQILGGKCINAFDSKSVYKNCLEISKKRESLSVKEEKDLKPEETSYIMNTTQSCEPEGEVFYHDNREKTPFIDLTGDSRKDRKICERIKKNLDEEKFSESIRSVSVDGHCINNFDTKSAYKICVEISEGRIDQKDARTYEEDLRSGKVEPRTNLHIYKMRIVRSNRYTGWTKKALRKPDLRCEKYFEQYTVKLSGHEEIDTKMCMEFYNKANKEKFLNFRASGIMLTGKETKQSGRCYRNFRRLESSEENALLDYESHIPVYLKFIYRHHKPASDKYSLMSLCMKASRGENLGL